jgi:ABC-2 type transport system permease protein
MLDKLVAVLQKDLITAIRYRSGILLSALAPAAQLVTFYYLARAVGPQFRPDGMSYFMFLLVGTGFYTFLITGMHSLLRVIQEAQQSGTLEAVMSTVTRPITLLSLSGVSAFAGAFVQFGLYGAAGVLLFRPPVHFNFVASALVIGLSVLIAFAIGVFAAGLQVATHKGSILLWIIGSTAWVIAGTLFPVSALPQPMRLLAQVLPVTHCLNALRLATSAVSVGPSLSREIATLMLFSVLLVPLAILFFSWTIRRARQMGTLSFY